MRKMRILSHFTARRTNGSTYFRFGRGVKTLRDMIKQIKSGKAIVMDDVPPPLAQSTKSVPSKILRF